MNSLPTDVRDAFSITAKGDWEVTERKELVVALHFTHWDIKNLLMGDHLSGIVREIRYFHTTF